MRISEPDQRARVASGWGRGTFATGEHDCKAMRDASPHQREKRRESLGEAMRKAFIYPGGRGRNRPLRSRSVFQCHEKISHPWYPLHPLRDRTRPKRGSSASLRSAHDTAVRDFGNDGNCGELRACFGRAGWRPVAGRALAPVRGRDLPRFAHPTIESIVGADSCVRPGLPANWADTPIRPSGRIRFCSSFRFQTRSKREVKPD